MTYNAFGGIRVNASKQESTITLLCRTAVLCLCREVFFEANGVPRTVEIVDRSDQAEGGPVRKAAREKSDPDVLGSVGAPMAGEVIEVSAQPGWTATHVYMCTLLRPVLHSNAHLCTTCH